MPGSTMFLSEIQFANALPRIYVTLLGISMVVSSLQLINALSPIPTTVFGMTVFLQPTIKVLLLVLIMALQPFRESYTVLSSDVIESGITKLVGADGIRPYAYETIVVTVLGMTVFLQPTIKVLLLVLIMALQPFRESYTVLSSSTTVN